MKDKLRKIIMFILNPHLLVCLGIGWMITNGWSYVMMGFGTFFGINWMIAVSGAYLAFLWFPFTPEKIFTVIIAIFLLRVFFPKDEKTLAVLIEFNESIVNKYGRRKEKRRSRSDEDVKKRKLFFVDNGKG